MLHSLGVGGPICLLLPSVALCYILAPEYICRPRLALVAAARVVAFTRCPVLVPIL